MTVIKAAEALTLTLRPPAIRPSPGDDARRVDGRELARLLAAHETLAAERDALTEAVADLQARNRVLEEGLQTERRTAAEALAAQADALADAEARGREAGRQEGAAAKAELLAALEGGLLAARDRVADELRGLESLAIHLARAALAKVFGEADDLAGRMPALIRRQMERVERDLVLQVTVGGSLFADEEALARLARESGMTGVEILADPVLAPGACRLRLRLGEMDIGVDQQWAEIERLLAGGLDAGGVP